MIGASLIFAVAVTVAVPASGQLPPANVLLVHEAHAAAAEGSGTVNRVDAPNHKINISHAPIRSLHWPSMTMDFPVSPDVDLSTIREGSKVKFTLIRTEGGTLEVHSIQSAGGK